MRIAHINIWYSKGFGYTENMLPKALARLGHEVHLITTNTQIYWYESMYKDVYEPMLGPGITSCDTFEENNVIIHRLPFYLFCPFKSKFHQFEQFGMMGIYQLLERIKPDVIQTQGINLISTFYAARYAKRNKIRLYTENHIHKSVFNPGNKNIRQLYNFINPFLHEINRNTTKCFPISSDAAELCYKFYKVPKKKIIIQSLGVDTDMFFYKDHLKKDDLSNSLRHKLGIKEEDIIAIYTGRFTEEKNPLCLAKAIDALSKEGFPFKGLFIGKGEPEYSDLIKECEGCFIIDFLPHNQLPQYYWSSDIGVWPREESTSQLDAMACGLPLILSNRIEVHERIEGNGYLYDEGDFSDLKNNLLNLIDKNKRKKLGQFGSEKVRKYFSWNAIANSRIGYYKGIS